MKPLALADSQLVHTNFSDSYFNYCLWPYSPPSPPHKASLAQINFLLASFRDHDLLEQGQSLLHRLAQFLGPYKTVFGIKQFADNFWWEFYIYDYDLQHRRIQANDLLHFLKPTLHSSLEVSPSLPYFMFSFQITPHQLRTGASLDAVDLYMGLFGGTLFAGKAYTLDHTNFPRLKNIYTFFDSKVDRDSIKQAVNCGAYLEGRSDIADLLLESQYADCDIICVSSKAANDCIYYSGLNIGQLIAFLRQFNHSPSLVAMAETYYDQLGHLLFDIGLDYCVTNQKLVYLKSSFYGIF